MTGHWVGPVAVTIALGVAIGTFAGLRVHVAKVSYDIVEDRRRVTPRFIEEVCFDCMRTADTASDQRGCLQQRVMLCRSEGYSSSSQLPGGSDLPGSVKDQARMGTFVSCACEAEVNGGR